LLASVGQDFLQDGDIVECRRVDDNAQYSVVCGGCDREVEDGELGVGAVRGGLVGGKEHGRVDLPVEERVVFGCEGDLVGVEKLVAIARLARYSQNASKDKINDIFCL
jgi:hypothetical protein